MVDGVPRRVHHLPEAPSELEFVVVADAPVRGRQRPSLRGQLERLVLDRHVLAGVPLLAAPRRRPVAHGIHVGGERFLALIGMGVIGVVAIADVALVVDLGGPKRSMGYDGRARHLGDALGVAEVVGMGVGDEDRMDPLEVEVSGFETGQERVPRRFPRKARVDKGDPVLVDDGIAVHMGQTGKRDVELHAQDVRPHFGDLRASRLLLLTFRGRGHERTSYGPLRATTTCAPLMAARFRIADAPTGPRRVRRRPEPGFADAAVSGLGDKSLRS